jgi:hypothetical protein
MKLLPIPYVRKLCFVLFIASTIIAFYFFAYSVAIDNWNIVTPVLPLKYSVWAEGVLFVCILIASYIGGLDEEIVVGQFEILKPNERRSLILLITVTVSIIVQIAIPIYFLGGAINSGFSNMLVTTCGVTVIVTNSPKIRWTIIVICIVIYISSAFYYFHIDINSSSGFKVFQIASVFITLGATLLLSWRGKFTIFDKRNGTASQALTPETSIPEA